MLPTLNTDSGPSGVKLLSPHRTRNLNHRPTMLLPKAKGPWQGGEEGAHCEHSEHVQLQTQALEETKASIKMVFWGVCVCVCVFGVLHSWGNLCTALVFLVFPQVHLEAEAR